MKLKNKAKILSAFFITSCIIPSVLSTIVQAKLAPSEGVPIDTTETPRRSITPKMLENIMDPVIRMRPGTNSSAVRILNETVRQFDEYRICVPGRLATNHELLYAYKIAARYRTVTGDSTLIDAVHDYIDENHALITQETAIELLIRSSLYGDYCSDFIRRSLIPNFNLRGDIINTRSRSLPTPFTPLEAAINSASPTTVGFLLDAGARTDLPNLIGLTPYQCATHYAEDARMPASRAQKYREIIDVFHGHGITR